MKKHAGVACFKLEVRKSIFYTFTLLKFVKTRTCRICNIAITSSATFLYFHLYLLGEYNFFSFL